MRLRTLPAVSARAPLSAAIEATAAREARPASSPARRVGRTTRDWGERVLGAIEHLVLALVALVPELAAQPGVIDSDTKTYLFVDPARFVAQSASMWDPTVGLGTVTHEQLGYLVPMGPFFVATHALGVPTWVAERLFVGLTLAAAGFGVLMLVRTLGLRGPGRPLAALAYMCSPYFLQYVGRISVILLPWAGLPWLLAFTIRALRRGGWRDPAWFALVLLAVSGVNASSVIYVGLAPVLWLPFAVVLREATWRRAIATALRIGVLGLGVCLWWIAGLWVEGAFGLNILRYTESVQATSSASLASEVLRGLGYWYFYGGGRLGPWTTSSVELTQQLWMLAASFAPVVLAFVAAVALRWRYRAYFVALVVVGVACAVGPYPFAHPSPFGALLKAFMTRTTAGFALRSTDRATPLVVLGLAVLLGAGTSALWARAKRAGSVAALGAACLVGLANVPAFNGTTVADRFTQPATLPRSVTDAAALLNRGPSGKRVLAIPGENFAAYRYGDTIDPIWPALLDRPFVTREEQVMGSLATQDMLYAIDEPMQLGTFDPAVLAPMARLMSVGDVLVQEDLAYERYDTPRPKQLAASLSPLPPGLGPARPVGAPTPNVSLIPMLDESALALPPAAPWPAPLEIIPVANPRPILRTESPSAPLVVDGDAQGIAEAASLGLLASDPTILYGATLATHPRQLAAALRSGATLVVTDTNRKRPFRWATMHENAGATLTANEPQPPDPGNAPLSYLPQLGGRAQSVAVDVGVRSVTASSYGNAVTYIPEDRPVMALDGNLDTAWETAAFGNPIGQWWQVTLDHPVTTDHITLVQPQLGDFDRHITEVTLTFDGRRQVRRTLGPASLQPSGEVVTFPTTTFTTLRITIDATNLSTSKTNRGGSAVGFAEVEIPGVRATELIRTPIDLLEAAGPASLRDRLVVVFDRERLAPVPPRSDPEPAIERELWLPTARTFTIRGLASVSALIPDDEIDRLMGRPGSNYDGLVAYSEGRLPGDLRASAAAALGGNPGAAWQPGFGASHQAGEWIKVVLAHPITIDHLDLEVLADGRHSVPTELTISNGATTRAVALPPIADARVPGAVASVPVTFPPVTGTTFTFTFTAVRLEWTINYFSQAPIALPLGIAALGIPGVTAPPDPPTIPPVCRDNLLSIDGKPVWLEVVGSTSQALAGGELQVLPCGPDAHGITLGPGLHLIEGVPATEGRPGYQVGFNLDQLVLDSAPGGGPEPDGPSTELANPPPREPAPRLEDVHVGTDTARAVATEVHGPFWLVLGESHDRGWQASVDGHPLGAPRLLDGFANAWFVDPAALGLHGRHLVVTLRFWPQRVVDAALAISGATTLACLALVGPRARRRTRRWWPGRSGGSSRRLESPGATACDATGRAGLRAATIGSGIGDATGEDVIANHPPGNAGVGPPGTGEPPSTGVGSDALARKLAGLALGEAPDEAPVLAGWPVDRAARSPLVALVAALLAGGVAAALVNLDTAIAVAIAIAAALLFGPARLVASVAAVVLVVAMAVGVVAHQASAHVPPGGFWPPAFATESRVAWMAVAFLGADALVGCLTRRSNQPEWRWPGSRRAQRRERASSTRARRVAAAVRSQLRR
jgi:arabinofuranan 3-O-arabinosyltransferase